jgi:hypothetical protein
MTHNNKKDIKAGQIRVDTNSPPDYLFYIINRIMDNGVYFEVTLLNSCLGYTAGNKDLFSRRTIETDILVSEVPHNEER